MKFMRHPAILSGLLARALVGITAQWHFGGGELYDGEYRTAREAPSHSTGTPNWTNASGFERNVFTFVRIRSRRNPRGLFRARPTEQSSA